MRNPLESTGWLGVKGASGQPRFIGTCFAFRRNDCLLTAAHCVRETAAESLFVYTHGELIDALSIERIISHPNADVAILRLAESHRLRDRFDGDATVYGWGVPVAAFGYPEDTGESGLEPTPRFFRGNIQRMFKHVSHDGYSLMRRS
jgi:hypothetical protein